MPQTPPPVTSSRRRAAYWTGGTAAYLGLGFSLGWYYTFTYYGRTGIPMPHPESWAAILLYYFSVLNVDTEIQAVHWMAAFPLAGALWALALVLIAPRLGAAKPGAARLYAMLALASLPMVAPGPAMAILAGWHDGGFSASHMIAVALRRANRAPDAWITPLYLTLGCASLALQWRVIRSSLAVRTGLAIRIYLLAAIALCLAAMIAGSALFYPLHLALE